MVALWLFWWDSSRESSRGYGDSFDQQGFEHFSGTFTVHRKWKLRCYSKNELHNTEMVLLITEKVIPLCRKKFFYNDPNRFRRLENFNHPRKTDFRTAKKVFLNAENKLPSFIKISRRMKMNVIRKRFSWSPKKWFLVSWKDFLTTANRLKAGKLLSLT